MSIKDIEAAALSALQGITYLRTIEGYAGQLEDDLPRMSAMLPAAFVAYAGSDFARLDRSTHEERLRLSVILAASSLRGAASARTGSGIAGAADERGAYGMVDDTLAALTGSTLGGAVSGPLAPDSVSMIVSGADVSAYAVEFTCTLDRTFI